jgi:uncharacterized protein (AIM24 family)
MAKFEIEQGQFQRWVKITINNEAVRAEAGALSYMRGNIEVDTPLPSPGTAFKSIIAGEPLIRPRYMGAGEIYLTSSFGGYHAFEVAGVPWILEDGAYWASDDSVQLGFHRERMLTSLWAGEGFVDIQTKVSGHGCVVLNAEGPVEEIDLGDEMISVEGKLVIARTADVVYDVARPTRSLFSYMLSGEEYHRRYRGPGKVLLVSTPYMRRPTTADMPDEEPDQDPQPEQPEAPLQAEALDQTVDLDMDLNQDQNGPDPGAKT